MRTPQQIATDSRRSGKTRTIAQYVEACEAEGWQLWATCRCDRKIQITGDLVRNWQFNQIKCPGRNCAGGRFSSQWIYRKSDPGDTKGSESEPEKQV